MTFPRNILNIKELELTYEDEVPQADDVYHSRIGEDTPDFSKFASGDVNWWHGQRIEVKATIKPKAHIICDPSFDPSKDYWSEFVIKNNCEVFVLIDCRLIKVETLEELQFYREFATPCEDEKEVNSVAAPYGLKPKQIKVIHYGNRIKIINELSGHQSYPVIDLNEFVYIKENFFSKMIMSIPKEAKVILKVDHSTHYPLITRYLSIIDKYCKVENIIYDCRKATGSDDDRRITALVDKSKVDHFTTSSVEKLKLLSSQNPGLRHLTYIGDPNEIDSELLKNVESLSFVTSDAVAYCAESITDWLKAYPKLTKLALNMSIYFEKFTSTIPGCPQLTVLHLTGEIDLQSLVLLIALCPGLEEIELKDIVVTNHTNFDVNKIGMIFLKLKKIRFIRVNNSDDGKQMDCGPLFFKLINTNHNLEEINVQSSFLTGTDEGFINVEFSKLSYLIISGRQEVVRDKQLNASTIDESVVISLLHHSPNLKHLDIDLAGVCRRISQASLRNQFPLLEFIALNNVSSGFVTSILLKTKYQPVEMLERYPNLKILSANVIRDRSFKEDAEFYAFPKLRSWSIHDMTSISKVNSSLSSYDFLFSDNFEIVEVTDCDGARAAFFGGCSKYFAKLFRYFTKIKFLDMESNTCLTILSLTTELQSLEVTLNEKSTLPEKIAFPYMTKLVLKIKKHNASVDLLMKRLLASAPNLKKLSIYYLDMSGMHDALKTIVLPVNDSIDLSSLEELRLQAVAIPEGGKLRLGQLKLLELRNCIVPSTGSILDTATNLEILTGYLGGGYAAGQVSYLIKLIGRSQTLKSLKLICTGAGEIGEKLYKMLAAALSGKNYRSLHLSPLPDSVIELLAAEFPYGIEKIFSSTLTQYGARNSLRKSSVPKMTSQVLDNKVVQREIPTIDLIPYVTAKILFPIDQYREDIFPHLVIDDNGDVVANASNIPAKVCKTQPKQTTNLYEQFCKLQQNGEFDYYYIEKTLDFPPSFATLTGCTPVDEIEAFEADAKVVFSQNEESGQYLAASNSRKVNIAYLVKAKKNSYVRNQVTADKFDISQIKRIVADFHFVHDEKSNKIAINKGQFCRQFDDNTLFLAAVALTTDKNTWCNKEDELIKKGIDFSKLKGIVLLDAIREHTTGACRHQAYFIKALADALGIRCQIIVKRGLHAFVQFTLNIDGKNVIYSERLGGYQANTIIKKSTPGQLFKQQVQSVVKEHKSTKSLLNLSIPAMHEIKRHDKDEKKSAPVAVLVAAKKPFKLFYNEFMAKLDQQPSLNEKTGLLYVSNGKNPLLSCTAKLMEVTNEQGHRSYYIDDIANVTTDAIKDGLNSKVGSDLKQFLEQAQPGDVLIIRCPKAFSSRSLLYNALDGSRHIKNMKIPPGVKIIGIVERENITKERAFLRRFKVKPQDANDLVDLSVDLPVDYLAEQCIAGKPVDEKCITKDFCGGDLFKQDMFGIPDFKATGAYFQPGLLNEVLDCKAHNPVVEIINCGSEREQELALLSIIASGEAFINGEWRKVPKFRLLKTDRDYDFSRECKYETTSDENISDATYVLNPTSYPQFIKNYSCDDKTHSLLTPDGLLANFKGKTLTIRATKSLKKVGHWQRFFAEARKQSVFLRILRDPGVEIPGLPTLEAKQPLTSSSSFSILLSSKPYENVSAYAQAFKPDLMVNVGRTHHYTDLIQRLVPLETKAGDLPRYHCQVGQVAQLLIDGKSVMLVGDVSEKLAESLETLSANPPYLMVKGVHQPVKGRLLLLTNNSKLLRSCYQESKQVLIKSTPKLEAKEHKYSISDPKDEQEIRMKAVCAELSTSPCVLLEGPTAAGKSTAIRRYLAKYYGKPVTLFEGIKSLDKFAEFAKGDTSDHILFIDECDLQQEGAYDIFEGAYNPVRPNLLAQLQAVDWEPNMKVVFAGNGGSYHARIIHDFFTRHPDLRVNFPAFSQEYIRNYILRSLLGVLLPGRAAFFDQIIDLFFAASQYVKEPRVVTLRNWSQMCLRLALRLDGDIIVAAKLAAYDELSSLQFEHDLPGFQTYLFGSPETCANRLAVVDNDAARKLTTKLAHLERSRLAKEKRDPVDRFILTPNRYHEARMIMDALAIRELREKYVSALPDIRYFGTFGTVLTGSSEVGKSSMVVEILQAMGFKEGMDAIKGKKYCLLTAFNVKEADAAFHEGSIVVRDEYNATFNEANDNAYLSAADNHGRDAGQIGWTMFATENSIDHDGRIVPSKAAANRCHYVTVKPYTMFDYRLILQGWGLSASNAERLLKTKNEWNLGDLRDAARQQLVLQPSVAEEKDLSVREQDFIEIPQKVATLEAKRSSGSAINWGMFVAKTIAETLFAAGAITLYMFFPQLLAVKVLACVASSMAGVSFLNRLRKLCCLDVKVVSSERSPSPSSHARMGSVIHLERNAHGKGPEVVKESREVLGVDQRQRVLSQQARVSISPRL